MYNMLLGIDYNASNIASGILMCIVAVLSIAIIVLVLLQKGSGDGVSAITGNSGYENDSEVGTGRKRLRLLTIILGAVLAVIAIIFFAIAPTSAA